MRNERASSRYRSISCVVDYAVARARADVRGVCSRRLALSSRKQFSTFASVVDWRHHHRDRTVVNGHSLSRIYRWGTAAVFIDGNGDGGAGDSALSTFRVDSSTWDADFDHGRGGRHYRLVIRGWVGLVAGMRRRNPALAGGKIGDN